MNFTTHGNGVTLSNGTKIHGVGNLTAIRLGPETGDAFRIYGPDGSNWLAAYSHAMWSAGGMVWDTGHLPIEYGTWSPALTPSGGGAAAYDELIGSYIKIGRKISIWVRMTLKSVGTLSGSLYIALPSALYSAYPEITGVYPIAHSRVININFPSTAIDTYAIIAHRTSLRLDFKGQESFWFMDASNLKDNAQITFNIEYLGL